MTDNKEKSNFWTTLPGVLTGLTGLITAIGGIYLGTHTSNGPRNPEVSPAVSPSAQTIVGAYKYRDKFGSDFIINFLSDGSAIQSNSDAGRWYKEASGSYTLELNSKWKFVDLRLDGSVIKGIVIDPNGKQSPLLGEKQ